MESPSSVLDVVKERRTVVMNIRSALGLNVFGRGSVAGLF